MKLLDKPSENFHLSNPDKIYWPKEKFTKQDLLDYYLAVSSTIFPYLKNRPIVLRRFPNGIEGENFVQKDTSSLHLPKGINTIKIEHEEKDLTYLMIDNLLSLEYAVNLGAIELHPFHSQVKHLDFPDYFILDLDPESVPFNQVIETALTIHEQMSDWDMPHYCKTSGGRGLHIYIPLHGKYTTDQVSQFGQLLGMLLHEKLPKITSLERSPANRQKKIYLDVLQNRAKQTIVSAYSVRGREGATVSTPLEWKEVKKGITPQDFTIKTVPERLKKKGDVFSSILGKGFNLKKWLLEHLQ